MGLIPTALAAALLAHFPYMSTDEYGAWEDPFRIVDNEMSIVLYDHVTCEAEEVWMRFRFEEPGELFLQLGVPVLDRLEGYRPTLAILAPGLPEIDLPFDTPPGMGGILFDTRETASPTDFYEEFTETSSWIWAETNQVFDQPLDGYIVAFDPEHRTGKLWIAVGTLEDFSMPPEVTFEDVWTFHETMGYGPDPIPAEEVCESDMAGDSDSDGDLILVEGACSVGEQDDGLLPLLGLLLAPTVRRRLR